MNLKNDKTFRLKNAIKIRNKNGEIITNFTEIQRIKESTVNNYTPKNWII